MLSLPILLLHKEVRVGLFFRYLGTRDEFSQSRAMVVLPYRERLDGKIISVREDRMVGVSDVYTD
jgi:hypothetical protein